MKITGIVCEYNPFHSGHKYMIDEIKKQYNSDYIIAIMSGNYVQRGLPAFMDKYARAKIALQMGVDLVIELPVVFATSSSEVFASASVNILSKCGITDLVFGSECNDIHILKQFAHILKEEPDDYKLLLKEELKSGSAYGAAKYNALIKYIDKLKTTYSQNASVSYLQIDSHSTYVNYSADEIREILSSPNNNLGIEYIKAIMDLENPIEVHTLQRINGEYHDTASSVASYSATALRLALKEENFEALEDDYLRHLYKENYNKTFPVLTDDFSSILGSSLVKINLDDTSDFIDYYGVTEALSHKITNSLYSYKSFSEYTDILKTKEIAHSAVYRGLLHILLDIKENDVKNYIQKGYTDYVKVLGTTKKGSSLISNLRKNLITIVNTKKDEENISKAFAKLYKTNLYADDLYRMIQVTKFGIDMPNEYTRKFYITD